MLIDTLREDDTVLATCAGNVSKILDNNMEIIKIIRTAIDRLNSGGSTQWFWIDLVYEMAWESFNLVLKIVSSFYQMVMPMWTNRLD